MTTDPRFDKVRTELDFPRDEREIAAFWQESKIFEKSLEQTASGPPFVFYEGPPTANGLPHNGHVLTRVIKDLFPRYKTMRGFHVARKAGWDTHGLPVEVEVEKELRIHGKAAIEQFGVEPFVKRCIESRVPLHEASGKTAHELAHRPSGSSLDERVRDLSQARYVESVWWALSELFKKGLLYQGHKVVWWWAQGGTALSAAEVGQGYQRPSTIQACSSHFRCLDDADGTIALVVWTTTPWTLAVATCYAAASEHEVRRTRSLGAETLEVKAQEAPRSQRELGVVASKRARAEKLAEEARHDGRRAHAVDTSSTRKRYRRLLRSTGRRRCDLYRWKTTRDLAILARHRRRLRHARHRHRHRARRARFW